jgi:subtilisin family serine protease
MRYSYKAAGKLVELDQDPDLVAVRFKEPALHSVRARVSRESGMSRFNERFELPGEPYTVLPVDQVGATRAQRSTDALQKLQASDDVSRATPVFRHGEARVVATHRVLVGLKDAANAQALFGKYGATVLATTAAANGSAEYQLSLAESADPLQVASALASESGVDYAEPDFVSFGKHIARRVVAPRVGPSPSDPASGKQYAINITHAVNAWLLRRGDPAIKIAILDEGVDTAHEDLAASIVGAFDALENDAFQQPNAWDGHGTACAGLAAARHNTLGIQGIGGGCSLLAVRIARSPSPGADWETTNSQIALGIDWAWQNGASILSNSWGGGAPSTAISNAFERARTQGRGGKGCVIVVAAGNDSRPVDFPGTLPNMLTVSASNEFDEFKTKTSRDGENWWGSNFGPEVSVAAPGVHNWTTDISGSAGYTSSAYTDFNGTSSATPIVAGACALVLSADPSLTERRVREIIISTADKVGAAAYVQGRNDQFGFGRLNCRAAVQAALPQAVKYIALHRATQTVQVRDNLTSELSVSVGDARPIKELKVHVEIAHT